MKQIKLYDSLSGLQNERNMVIEMSKITKDTIVADVLKISADTAPFFLEIGMHCLGCPSATGETIEQACAVHGVDADALIKKLNDFIGE